MNTRLEKLFDEYTFSDKDRYEFMQIYSLLPDYKRSRVIDRFDEIAKSVQGLQDQLRAEHEILFGKALENIEAKIKGNKKSSITEDISAQLQELRSMI